MGRTRHTRKRHTRRKHKRKRTRHRRRTSGGAGMISHAIGGYKETLTVYKSRGGGKKNFPTICHF